MGSIARLTLALAAALSLLPGIAAAQNFPSKPLKYIVPFPPGGPTDTFSRALAARLAETLGQPVIVENVPGAGASIGMDRVAKSAPDGYTIGLATTGSHAINPALYGSRLTYNALKDFTHLSLAVSYINVLVVHPGLPIKSVAELVAYAKANPGKVNFGSAGNGASNHLSGELLKTLSGAPMQHVPYKGSAPALTDVIAGQLTFMFDIPNVILPQIRSGRVRALAVTSAQRSPYAPEIPTMAEAGLAGYAEAGSDLWFGIVGPAGIPRPVADKLNAELVRALRSPEMGERIKTQFFNAWPSGIEEFYKVVESDMGKWGKIVRASGARVD
ncbi:MAG: tripartite tricarboxylate transporter substrate binding protein [Betaproteobacteria bacterium]|nr:tripartite tricarboxylate transporter substrate binding protein [Betaproteobacteria bacterium]